MSSASVNGISIGYDDVGDGDALVLVHGHPFNRTMWWPQVEHFSRSGWRVVAPDLRGYGDSTVAPGRTRLDAFAHDLVGLLDHLGLDRIVLAGLSMGGQIVMEFYRLFPERVQGVVLADTTPAAETSVGKKVRIDTAERLLGEGMGPYAKEMLPKMVAPPNIQALPTVAEHVQAMMRGTSPEGAAAALRGRAERRDYVAMLSGITVPTLVVVGRDDEFTSVDDARFMHERVPGSTLAIIDDAGHLPNLERHAEFNAAVQVFLDSLRGVRPRQTGWSDR